MLFYLPCQIWGCKNTIFFQEYQKNMFEMLCEYPNLDPMAYLRTLSLPY